MSVPCFSDYLRQQVRRDDAIGDLARDAARDPTLSTCSGFTAQFLRARLLQLGACEGALLALDRARAEHKAGT